MAKDSAKKHCGSFVVMRSGKRYLFSVEDSRVAVEGEQSATATSTQPRYVVAYEGGKEVFRAPFDNVDCWGGETWFFKDAWWGKQ